LREIHASRLRTVETGGQPRFTARASAEASRIIPGGTDSAPTIALVRAEIAWGARRRIWTWFPGGISIIGFGAQRHDRAANLFFVDGHIETWQWRDSRTTLPRGQGIPMSSN
jgi:prepilin-type processing-associated H-X9-DG protein